MAITIAKLGFEPKGRGSAQRRAPMTIFQEIVLSILVAIFTITMAKLIWSALAAVW
jgi:hypothetical protein